MPPPHEGLKPKTSKKKARESNLELYRIIVMLLIVAHHYVVNSGLLEHIQDNGDVVNNCVMLLFGAWGKTGINCFVLITGYFMCTSRFTLEKLAKLYIQIVFYALIIYGIFCITGHETFSPFKLIWKLWPIKSIASGFTSCFLLFYLFIPILNIIVNSLGKEMHKYLMVLLIAVFTILPSFPMIRISFNYVTWFMALYMIASYIRLYGLFPKVSHDQWGLFSVLLIIIGSISVLGMELIFKMGYTNKFYPYFFIADSNKFLSLAIATSSFMYFKDLKIPYSRWINALGGATFGVFLIHANSDAMRLWLWRETVDCIGHFRDSLLWTLGYAVVSVLLIFIVCAGIEWFRGQFIEPYILNFLSSKLSKIKQKLSLSFQ